MEFRIYIEQHSDSGNWEWQVREEPQTKKSWMSSIESSLTEEEAKVNAAEVARRRRDSEFRRKEAAAKMKARYSYTYSIPDEPPKS